MNERLVQINEKLNYARNIPQNKWDYGKQREMYENRLQEARKRLDEHKKHVDEVVSKYRLHGVAEADIQKNLHQSFSHQHIQLLEAIISAKKALAMMDIETVEELTRQKIDILEDLAK